MGGKLHSEIQVFGTFQNTSLKVPLVLKVSQVLTGILNHNLIISDISAESFMKVKHLSLKIWSVVVFTFPSPFLLPALATQTARLQQEVRGWGIGVTLILFGAKSENIYSVQEEARRNVSGGGE